jgi:AI-2 transport protein TqsA
MRAMSDSEARDVAPTGPVPVDGVPSTARGPASSPEPASTTSGPASSPEPASTTSGPAAPSPATIEPAVPHALSGDPLRVLGAVVLVLVALLALREVAGLVIPILFGLFLALVASSLVGALGRRGLSHRVALGLAMVAVLGVVLVTAGAIALSIGELVVHVPRYADRFDTLAEQGRSVLAGLGIAFDPGALPALVSPEALASVARTLASSVSGAAGAMFILAFTLIYALTGAPRLQGRAERVLGDRHTILRAVERFEADLRVYLVVRAQLGVFAAVLVLILLVVLGVPLPFLWAFLVFAASFIPTIGTFIALVPPTIFALLEGGIVPAGAVVVGFALVNFAQDYLLQPRLMGNELNLSPLVVFLSVILWAWVLGAAGALLAVPMTVGLVGILESYPGARPIVALLRNELEEPVLGP